MQNSECGMRNNQGQKFHSKEDRKRKLFLLFACAAFIAAVFFSSQIAENGRFALKVCAETIIPSLFPFFILSGLVSRLGLPVFLGNSFSGCAGRLFGVSGAGITALFMGLTGGYPMGAGYIAELVRQGQIDLEESEKLLAFCNNSGPAFIIGAVGCGVFGSVKIGACLYIVHIFSAVSVGFLLRGEKSNFSFPEDRKPAALRTELSFPVAFTEAVRTAVSSIINVCGFAVFFTVMVRLAENIPSVTRFLDQLSMISTLDPACLRTLFSGFFELGCSVSEMAALPPTPSNLALVSFILGWGGLSVHLQTRALLSDTEIKGALHTAGHLMSASLGSVLSYLLFSFLKI